MIAVNCSGAVAVWNSWAVVVSISCYCCEGCGMGGVGVRADEGVDGLFGGRAGGGDLICLVQVDVCVGLAGRCGML